MRKGVRGAIMRTLARSRHICEKIADEGFRTSSLRSGLIIPM
jgi:hypothetical protein